MMGGIWARRSTLGLGYGSGACRGKPDILPDFDWLRRGGLSSRSYRAPGLKPVREVLVVGGI